MEKENVKVFTTRNYSLLKPIAGNRGIDLQYVEQLKKAMSEDYLLTILLVNAKNEIIDGQHRFEAIKQLGLEVNYAVQADLGWPEVQIYNKNLKKWATADYLNGYISLKKEAYIQFKNFKEKFGFEHSSALMILAGHTAMGGRVMVAFREGTLKIKSLEEANKIANFLLALEPYFKEAKKSKFVAAFMHACNDEDFDPEKLKRKLVSHPYLAMKCATKEQYIQLIEEIYNYRRKKSERIFLG